MAKNTEVDDYKEIESYLGYSNLYCGLWMAFMDERLFHSSPGINIIDDIELDALKVLDKSEQGISFAGSGDLRIDRYYSSEADIPCVMTYPFIFQAHGHYHAKRFYFDELALEYL